MICKSYWADIIAPPNIHVMFISPRSRLTSYFKAAVLQGPTSSFHDHVQCIIRLVFWTETLCPNSAYHSTFVIH